MTGLMESMVPSTAVAADTRPPRLRKCRSSTVNQWHRCSLLASTQSRTASMLSPRALCWAACQSSRPWPREAHSVSTTYTLRSGYFSPSSCAAIWAEWQVADRAEEKASTSTSLPAWSRGSIFSVKSEMFTAEVVAISPSRSRR